jgi:hypothetical protein
MMDYEPTWEDVEEEPSLLERGPKVEAENADLHPPLPPFLRIVVDGETFIAFLDPRFESIKTVIDDDGTYVAFTATDTYDAIGKAQAAMKEREAAKKRKSKPRRTTQKPREPHS